MKQEVIEQTILEGFKPLLDRMDEQVTTLWMKQWKLWQKANLECTESDDYKMAMEHSKKVYEQYTSIYKRIISGEITTSCSVEEAKQHVQYFAEQYIKSINHNQQMYAKRGYYELCGYDKTKSYADKHNRNVMKSYEASMIAYFYKGLESVQRKIKKEINEEKMLATRNILKAANKVLATIAEDIKEIKLLNAKDTPKGFVANFQICGYENIYHFNTECIEAGGYNIQRYHYRYISHLKKQ